jgi:hypothetical protein
MIGADLTLTVRVPLTIRRRGGRKLVVAPEGSVVAVPARVDNALVKALARAFRWRRMLEEGRYGTIDEIAAAERINDSYVSRVLRLTLLAPDIIEAILDGRQPPDTEMHQLLRPFSVRWEEQRRTWLQREDDNEGRPAPRMRGVPRVPGVKTKQPCERTVARNGSPLAK